MALNPCFVVAAIVAHALLCLTVQYFYRLKAVAVWHFTVLYSIQYSSPFLKIKIEVRPSLSRIDQCQNDFQKMVGCCGSSVCAPEYWGSSPDFKSCSSHCVQRKIYLSKK